METEYERERDAAAIKYANQFDHITPDPDFKAGADWARKHMGCARDQKTTQFCAEVVDLQRRAEKLVEALITLMGWAERNHEMPNYSEAIAEAQEAITEWERVN